eukprot:178364_1
MKLIEIILPSICFIISLPIYFYGIMKWIAFSRHYYIRKRFPLISILMAVASFLNGTLFLIIHWLKYYTKRKIRGSIPASASYFIYTLINLRLFLIFMRDRQHKQYLLIMPEIKSETVAHSTIQLVKQASISVSSATIDSNNITNTTTKAHKTSNIYYHPFSIILLLFAFIGAIIILPIHRTTTNVSVFIIATCWTFQFCVTLALIAIMCIQNVKEGIGCLREAFVMLLASVILSSAVAFRNLGNLGYITFTAYVLAPYFQGLYPLFIAIYYIYKCENTLDHKKWIENGHENVIENKYIKQEIVEVDTRTIDTNVDFFTFLKEPKNYIAFKQYCCHCWAIENLLFIERVSVIYNVILKYKNKINSEDNDKKFIHVLSAVEFIYLTNIYNYYQKHVDEEDLIKKQ